MTRDPTPAAPTIADRPRIPPDYGVPSNTKGLVAWNRVAARLTEARVYWVATAGPDGQPRVRPVDGIYVDGTIFVGGSLETRWARDLIANPRVAVHLDDGHDVVIVEGEAELLEHGVDPATAERLAAASNAKYPEYGVKASDYAGPGPFAIRPHVAYAWSSFPKDVTRFRFEEGAAPG